MTSTLKLKHVGNQVHIQALRGFAVSLVLFYHLDLGVFQSGFLGVDVFFVISGFLITRSIVQGLESGTFGLIDFYFRRAKRLLPAAYFTLLMTALIAPYFLTSPQMDQFKEQLIGAVFFSANIVLWSQSGYFDIDAASKPLLHFWSLAIEEQYYLLLPFILICISPKNFIRLRVIATITVASLLFCLLFPDLAPSAKFYLLHTRAWELGLGSLGALAQVALRNAAVVTRLPALAILLVIPFVGSQGTPPGPLALAVCLSTLIVILGFQETHWSPWPVRKIVRMFARIGDFSYSLYLVHWPIIVFMKSGFTAPPPAGAYVVAFVLSLGTGYLLFRLIEQPVRYSTFLPSFKTVATVFAGSLFIVSLPFAVPNLLASSLDFADIRRLNFGLAQECDQVDKFLPLPSCRTSDQPRTMVWGDSHAMHLLEAFEGHDQGVIQATKSGCAPFIGIAPHFDGSPVYTAQAARSCIAFNNSVLDYLETAHSVDVVVLGAALSLFRPESALVARTETGFARQKTTIGAVARSADETVKKLRALGKKVVLMESPPYAGFNIGACLERRAQGLLQFGDVADCNFSISVYRQVSDPEINLARAIAEEASLPTKSFADYLCASGVCETSPEGHFLYIDDSHLTYEGARYLGNRMTLAEELRSTAR